MFQGTIEGIFKAWEMSENVDIPQIFHMILREKKTTA